MEIKSNLKSNFSRNAGADPGFWLRGVIFFHSHGVWGPSSPQWAQGNALVGAQVAKPPEAPEI